MNTSINTGTKNMMKKLQLLLAVVFIAGSLFSGIARAEIHTIDLLVLHPPKSVLNTDTLTRVASMEQYANKALENSKSSIRFRVVKIAEIDLPNPKTDNATLRALKNSRKAQELRAKYGADLVTMITPTGPYCGVGYVLGGANGKVYSGHKRYGFNVVADRCVSSFAHELGHNLGLGHSAKQGSTGGLYSWGRGHGEDSKFVTTMAYVSAYKASRVPFFSNPDLIECRGLACGKSIEDSDGANAVKAIDVSGPQIASWNESSELISNVNLAPAAAEDFAITHIGEAVEIAVLDNDVDPEQDTLNIESVSDAHHGTASVVNGIIHYFPEPSFIGQDSFQYTINDGYSHPVNATVTVNVGWGVNYQYFQGTWNELPNFDTATVLKEGISHNFSLEQRLRENNFGFRYFAQLKIPQSGNYQFYLTSDNGSKLIIDDVTVINNDESATTGNSINLDAGLHSIEVHYFQATGNQRLNVEWQGPGFIRQIMSSSSLRLDESDNSFPVAADDIARTSKNTEILIDVLKNDIDTDGDAIQLVSIGEASHGDVNLLGSKLIYQPDLGYSGTDQFSYIISDGNDGEDTGVVTIHVRQGVSYEYYEGSWSSLPDFDSLTPVASGKQNDFSLTNRNKNDNFAFRFRSGLDVPHDGRYYIFLISDDGSKIFIDGELLVNNDGVHGRHFEYSRIELTAGLHDIEVQYFEETGRERLAIYWWERKMGFKKVNEKYLKAID